MIIILYKVILKKMSEEKILKNALELNGDLNHERRKYFKRY